MSLPPEDYEVGYKRPPKATRWKRGHSGNPARRRPTRTVSALEAIDKHRPQTLVIVGDSFGISRIFAIAGSPIVGPCQLRSRPSARLAKPFR